MEYRNDEINKFMNGIEFLLEAISEKHPKSLGVMDVMKQDPLMLYDDAIRKSMMTTANKALINVIALATGFDRVVAMVNQMADELDKSGHQNRATQYRNRLEILTNFDRIANEFNPSKIQGFAHIATVPKVARQEEIVPD